MTTLNDGFDGIARNLVAGYVQNLDTRDLEGLVALFATDGVVVTSGIEKQGRDGIRAWYVDVFAQNPPGLHLLANTIVKRVSDTTGAARSDEMFYRKNADGVWTPQVRYVYLDTFVVEDSQWRIARHEMVRVD